MQISEPLPKRRTRILFVCHTHPKFSQGGAEITAYENFQRASADPAYSAWFFASNGQAYGKLGAQISQPFGEREFIHSGSMYNYFRLSNPDAAFEREFGAVLAAVKPDIVHFHHFLGVGMEAFSYVRRHAPRAKVILTLHEYLAMCHHHGQMVTRPDLALCDRATPAQCAKCFPDLSAEDFQLRELWVKRFISDVDVFVAPSRFLQQRYVAWGLPASKFRQLPNILPDEPALDYQPAHERRPGAMRIGFFGQISPLKGVSVVIKAAKLLQRRSFPGIFEIHGTYEHQPTSFQDEIKRLFEDLPENVLLKGRYPNGEVTRRMRTVDVVVVPSIWWENAPLVIEEAIRAQRIIVGSDLGGVAESLERTPFGRRFPVGDHVALADEIARLEALPRSDGSQDEAGQGPAPAWDAHHVLYRELIV